MVPVPYLIVYGGLGRAPALRAPGPRAARASKPLGDTERVSLQRRNRSAVAHV